MIRLLLIFFVFLTIPTISISEINNLDKLGGNDWLAWDISRKASYASGFMSAAGYLVENNQHGILGNPYNNKEASQIIKKIWGLDDPTRPKAKTSIPSFTKEELLIFTSENNKEHNSKLFRYYIGGIANGQLVEGLDILYKDFKNRGILLSDAIYVIKQQIEGTPPDDIEKILLYLRGGKSNQDLLTVMEKNEQGISFRYISFP